MAPLSVTLNDHQLFETERLITKHMCPSATVVHIYDGALAE